MESKKAQPETGVSQHSMEEQLHKQRCLLESLFNNSDIYVTILESLEAIVYVCDMETHEILYINDFAREKAGSVEGQLCWQAFQNQQDGPCDFCTNKMLMNSDGSISGQYVWEHQNPVTGCWYKLYDQAINWDDGRIVRLEIAFDITERKENQLSLANREALLEAMSFAAQQFLVTSSWEEPVQEFLAQLGLATKVSRVVLCRYLTGNSGEKISKPQYGWNAAGLPSLATSPILQNLDPHGAGIGRIRQLLEDGKVFSCNTSELKGKEKAFFQSLHIKSGLIVPIMIDKMAWGIIGLEDIEKEREWSAVEIKTLQTTANLLGSAIKRQQTEHMLKTEKRLYRAVLNDQSELICRYKDGGILTYVNKIYCGIFNRDEGDLIGSSFFDLLPETKRQLVEDHVASLTADNPIGTFVLKHIDENGKTIWYQWTDQVFLDEQNNITEYQAVGRDITQEKLAEDILRKNHEALESLVQRRTNELSRMNHQLIIEVAERQRAAKDLEEANIALRVLLQQSAGAEQELEKKILANINNLICPYLDDLGIHLKKRREQSSLTVIRENLKQITSSFSHKIKLQQFSLTPRETQVADLIRQGRTNKEIADILFLSPRTVETYRDKLRKKLGLRNKKVNLRSYLNTLG